MQGSEMEDKVWPNPPVGALHSRVRAMHHALMRRRSVLWWGISCAVHLLLVAVVGVLTRQISDVPQAPPIRVSVLPPMTTSMEADATPQARMPERQALDAAPSQVSPVDPDPIPTITPTPPLPAPL